MSMREFVRTLIRDLKKQDRNFTGVYFCFVLAIFVFVLTDFVDKSTKAGDFEMCVQWFQPELEGVSMGDPEDTQSQPSRAVWFLYAFNNKALDLTVNSVSGQVKAGLCHVIDSRAQALHQKLMVTLETAESDLALPVQSSQTAVGITDQSRGNFWHLASECPVLLFVYL